MARTKDREPNIGMGKAEGISKLLAQYIPRVIVKLQKKDDRGFTDQEKDRIKQHEIQRYDDIQRNPSQYLGDSWNRLRETHRGITIQKLITSVDPRGIQNLVDKASGSSADATYSTSSFLSYFAVRCPSREIATAVAEDLKDRQKWPMVEGAYVEARPITPPGVILKKSAQEGEGQGHLDPSPDNLGDPGGIDARYAWKFTGGDGAGLKFVDLEWGWVLDHEDLPSGSSQIPAPTFGLNLYDYYSTDPVTNAGHGTAALGIVVAQDNNAFIDSLGRPRKHRVGIAPHVATTNVESPWQWDPVYKEWIYSVADAIMSLINPADPVLHSGDVLLLEVQTQGDAASGNVVKLPVEVQEAEFIAIRLATAYGVVVIEAAGNGPEDLDTVLMANWAQTSTNPTGQFSLNRSNAQAETPFDYRPFFKDSGAIMVGSAEMPDDPEGNRARSPRHHVGSRLDCYAWDTNINTTGYFDETGPADPTGTPVPPTETYMGFSGTSGASAIIAGAALAVQGIAQADPNRNYRFSPDELRNILCYWKTGTLSANSKPDPDPLEWNADRIGVMPDLRKIITDTLKISES